MDNLQQAERSVQFENHQTTIIENLIKYFNKKCFFDVTLICEDKVLKAHRTILSSCSKFFEKILIARTEPDPIIVLNEIPNDLMKLLLEYMYKGHVSLSMEQFPLFLKTAKKLHIRGLNYDEVNLAETHSQGNMQVKLTQNGSAVLTETAQQNKILGKNKNVVERKWNLDNKEESKYLTSASRPIKRKESGKVFNPFAVKSKSFTDSDSTTFDENSPGPSRKVFKHSRRSEFSSSLNDSDVEFIDKSPTIVVIQDTQLGDDIGEVCNKVGSQVRNQNTQASKDLNFTSDESEIIATSPKKSKRNSILNSDEETRHDTTTGLVTSTASKSVSDGDTIRVNDKTESNKSTTEPAENLKFYLKSFCGPTEECFEGYLKTAPAKMRNFCFLCGEKKLRIRVHIEECHKFKSNQNKTYTCKTCSIMFNYKKMLELHECVDCSF